MIDVMSVVSLVKQAIEGYRWFEKKFSEDPEAQMRLQQIASDLGEVSISLATIAAEHAELRATAGLHERIAEIQKDHEFDGDCYLDGKNKLCCRYVEERGLKIHMREQSDGWLCRSPECGNYVDASPRRERRRPEPDHGDGFFDVG